MATTKVDINLISATGTASSSTFLRGDSAWSAPTGGLVFLSTATASGSASIDFDTIFSDNTSYDVFEITISNWRNAGDNINCISRITDDSGTSYEAGSQYDWISHGWSTTGAAKDTQNLGQGEFGLNGAANLATTETETNLSGTMKIYGPDKTGLWKKFEWQIQWEDASSTPNHFVTIGGGRFDGNTSAITGIQFLAASGNIAVGDFSVYGRSLS